jgi:hypothetical protein
MHQKQQRHHGRGLTISEALKKWENVFRRPLFTPVGFHTAPTTVQALKILNDFEREIARDPHATYADSKIFAHGDEELHGLKESSRSIRPARIIEIGGNHFILLGHQFGKYPVLLNDQENMPISFQNEGDAENYARYQNCQLIA